MTEGANARRAWFWPEGRRAAVATIAATVVTAIALTLWVLFSRDDDLEVTIMLGTAGTWGLLVSIHALLTVLAFRGLSGTELGRAVDASGLHRSARRAWPSWSVQVSVMALVVVVVPLIIPELRDHTLVLAVALFMVAASWANMIVSFALHYATLDDNALVFPDDDERSFGDYVYLSATIQASFAVPDVDIRTRVMRRQVTTHTLLAFVFNTVILAVVITLLMGG